MKTSLRFALLLSALTPWVFGADEATPAANATPAAAASDEPAPQPDGPRRPHAMETVAFIGVSTDPVSSALTDQLGLSRGEGLVVLDVVPGSPAADILKVHDVITRLDDQILIDPRQLSVLVRSHKVGDEVNVTLMRQGKESQVKIKLAGHMAPSEMQGHREVRILRMGSTMRGPGDMALDDMPPPPPGERGPGQGPDIRIESRSGGDGYPQMEGAVHALKWDTGNGHLVFSDDSGTLTLEIKDGKQTLVATDAKGVELFNGPVDTPDQRSKMTPELHARFQKLEGTLHGHLEFHGELRGGGMPPKEGGTQNPPAPPVQ